MKIDKERLVQDLTKYAWDALPDNVTINELVEFVLLKHPELLKAYYIDEKK
jgi:hypothetical protein